MINRGELLGMLICPACATPLGSFEKCDRCGAAFAEDGGTPVITSEAAKAVVSFRFDPSRSVAGDRFRASFSYPKRRGEVGPGTPYHLDAAHIPLIEGLPAGSTVLEIGCGGGQMRSFVASRNIKYIGIDISKSRVFEELRAHGGPDLLCDAHFLPFPDRSFDLVYTAAVTEHLACPQLVAQQVWRALKPGGYYLGNVSFLEPWHDDSYFHMPPLGVYELLTQADFEIEHIWPGQGYGGFGALMRMGNRATQKVPFLGDALDWYYKSSNRLRDLIKRSSSRNRDEGLTDAARMAGATDWIARRPL